MPQKRNTQKVQKGLVENRRDRTAIRQAKSHLLVSLRPYRVHRAKGAAMIDERIKFWSNPARWPGDPPGYVFLARAVHEVGKTVYGEEWTGGETVAREPYNFEKRPLLGGGVFPWAAAPAPPSSTRGRWLLLTGRFPGLGLAPSLRDVHATPAKS
jgi:hypothetical protein